MRRSPLIYDEETQADVKQPASHPTPGGVPRPWLLGSQPLEDNDATVPGARVRWPEPLPRRNARPSVKTGGMALSRTIGATIRLRSLSSWFGHALAIGAAILVGFLLVRAQGHASREAGSASSPAVAGLAGAPPTSAAPAAAPLPIPTSVATAQAQKPAIDVASLPVAPPARVAPPPRIKRTTTTKRVGNSAGRSADLPGVTARP